MLIGPKWRRWDNCLKLLANMEVRASHIFQEGNVPADILSNVALRFDGFFWWEMWDYAIPEIRTAVYEDRIGKCKYRFC